MQNQTGIYDIYKSRNVMVKTQALFLRGMTQYDTSTIRVKWRMLGRVSRQETRRNWPFN